MRYIVVFALTFANSSAWALSHSEPDDCTKTAIKNMVFAVYSSKKCNGISLRDEKFGYYGDLFRLNMDLLTERYHALTEQYYSNLRDSDIQDHVTFCNEAKKRYGPGGLGLVNIQ